MYSISNFTVDDQKTHVHSYPAANTAQLNLRILLHDCYVSGIWIATTYDVAK